MAKGRAKAKVVSPTVAETTRPLSYAIAFWGLMVILFFSPYLRGLFFASEQYWALILAAVLFFFLWLGKNAVGDNRMFEHPLDYLLLALPAVYLYSAFFAVNTGMAVDEIVRVVLYFLAFWIAARVVVLARDRHRLFHVIYLSAVGVALAGLATATGIIEIRDGFLGGRIYSSLQYPNALANYLMAVLFLGFYLWQHRVLEPGARGESPLARAGVPQWLREFDPYSYYYALANFLLLAVFFGTKSQGGWIIFGLLLPLFLIGLPAERRFPVVAHLFLIGIPALLAINRFLAAVAAERLEFAWVWVLLGLFLAAVGQFLFGRLRRSSLQPRIEAGGSLLVLGGFGLSLAAVGIFILANWEKVQALLKWHNLEHRLHFVATAWQMVLERPLTGWGGGGWAEAYQAFLPYLFTSRQVHGHYLQVGVETGIGGMLLFLAIWGVFLWTAYRLYRGAGPDPGRRILIWAVTVACLSVGAHSVLDFNFSLGALALVVWVLFGALVGLEREVQATAVAAATGERLRRKKRKQSSYVPPNYTRLTVAGVCAGLIVCGALALSTATTQAAHGVALFRQGQVTAGMEALQRAAAYNPFNAEYNYILAQVHQARGDFDAALAEIECAIAKSRYNPTYYELRAYIHQARGEYRAAVADAEKAVAKAPLNRGRYEHLVRIYFLAGYGEIRGENPEAAREHFEVARAVPERMAAIMDGLNETQKRLWMGPRLAVTPDMQFPLGAAQYFLGDFDAAAAALEAAAQTGDEATRGEILAWRAVVVDAQGDAERAAALLAEAEQLNPEVSQMYAELRELPVLKAE
jgi:tetratricopeptide (TPR) repeat protein